ncbi:transcriptional regulator (plasmid) [Rahnella aquatilis]|uniref:helix-turn-helix domain-containing protein n=2 Tax=Rahnella TaxID=34037 RepID=UPI0009D9ADB4|nr:helix-turn-helix domain-containing protein [Rahnella aceris]AYA09743.1 hypothetical protein D3Z09_24695 [Rahnella aquatilis]MCM2446577.1 transcriptional regulator [Rahnella sp. CG8]MQB52692.1 hypothetical protein [Rahnella sp. RcJ3]MBU9842777.1 helix-turn-helix domain-containing protein [Rahnella aceris]MBU9863502.1 helix-turn-helix domain-containing protein [Rahnella aceris]
MDITRGHRSGASAMLAAASRAVGLNPSTLSSALSGPWTKGEMRILQTGREMCPFLHSFQKYMTCNQVKISSVTFVLIVAGGCLTKN